MDDTTAWLQAAASEEAAAVRARSESPSPDSRGPVSAAAVLNQAYMRLLHWDPQDQKYPEVSCSLQNITSHYTLPFHLSNILLIIRKYSFSSSPRCMSKHIRAHAAPFQSDVLTQHCQTNSSTPSSTSPIMFQMCSFELMLNSMLLNTFNYINNVFII